MKKIDNKGFAISTMLYGLLIMSSTIIFMLLSSISFTKKSSTDFVTKTEKELNILSESIRTTTCPWRAPTEEELERKIVEGYRYDPESCITGAENTCLKTTCYELKTSGSCPTGTIIRYKVNDASILTFHVIEDYGDTMKMLSQQNIISSSKWNDNDDTTYGPLTALKALEDETSSWYNVNDMVYQAGTTPFAAYHAYTGCNSYDSCNSNKYTLPSKTVKARMIALQETSYLGCTNEAESCPKWVYNSLNSYGSSSGYWTMSALDTWNRGVWYVYKTGNVSNGDGDVSSATHGVRAVIQVNK